MFPEDSYLSSVFELCRNSWCNCTPTKRASDHSFITFNVFDIVSLLRHFLHPWPRPSFSFSLLVFFLTQLSSTLQLPQQQNSISNMAEVVVVVVVIVFPTLCPSHIYCKISAFCRFHTVIVAELSCHFYDIKIENKPFTLIALMMI